MLTFSAVFNNPCRSSPPGINPLSLVQINQDAARGPNLNLDKGFVFKVQKFILLPKEAG